MGERTSPSARYGQIDEHYAARLATCPPDDDGPIWMVNLMSYRDRAEYPDGRASDISGREADDRYTPLGPLAAIGAEIVFVADVDTQFLNPAPAWHRVAVVKYPTRRSFVEMSTRADFQELHHHKEAGMAHTFVIGCLPMPDVPFAPQDAVDWAAVPHPPSIADPYVQVIHVLRFYHAQSVDEMSRYTDHAAKIAVPHGVRISAWLQAEGTIIGDGRTWDQVRFNTFPSKQAFLDVVFDPERLAAQAEHREVALADTYTMILRPTLDRLHASIRGERPAELGR
jgi:hypothetical protein